jgi:hypothetical protein
MTEKDGGTSLAYGYGKTWVVRTWYVLVFIGRFKCKTNSGLGYRKFNSCNALLHTQTDCSYLAHEDWRFCFCFCFFFAFLNLFF